MKNKTTVQTVERKPENKRETSWTRFMDTMSNIEVGQIASQVGLFNEGKVNWDKLDELGGFDNHAMKAARAAIALAEGK